MPPFWLTPFTIGAETDSLNVPINVTGVQEIIAAPKMTNALAQNYPNPFSNTSDIEFIVPNENTNVSLAVYNEYGSLVKTLLSGVLSPGAYTARVGRCGNDARRVLLCAAERRNEGGARYDAGEITIV